MLAIYRKELTDYFTSARCLILLVLVALASALALYATNQGIRGASIPTEFIFLGLFTASGGATTSLFTFVTFISLFFIPIIGISLGFDAVNKERSSGTLSQIVSQPVFRDSIINGKFLAGIFILFIM